MIFLKGNIHQVKHNLQLVTHLTYIYLYTPQMRIGVRGWEKEGGEEEGGEEERMRWEEEGGEAR